jgi:Tol biopolymer transport system component
MTKRWFAVAVAVVAALNGAPALATVSGENGKIVYVVGSEATAEIYVANGDGSNPIRLTNNALADIEPVWSPDGRRIAFTSYRDGDAAVYTMALDGSNQQRLTAGADPAWSPDGTQIVFEGPTELLRVDPTYGELLYQDLWIVDVAGGAPRRLTDATSDHWWDFDYVRGVHYHDAAFSPDGRRLAWITGASGPTPLASANSVDLYVADVDHANHPVVFEEGKADPDWAPDGGTIVVTDWAGIVAIPHWLSAVDPDTGVTTKLDVPVAEQEFPLDAAFSPDGDSILVTMANGPDGLVRVDRQTLARTPLITGGWSGSWQPVNPYPMGLVDPGSGKWYLRDSSGRVTSFYYGNPGDVPFMGDWNCDGVDTPGLYRQSDGYVYLRNANTQGIADVFFFFGNPGDIPIAGDFDDDGCDTVSVYRPSQSRVFIINELGANGGGLGAAEMDYLFGNPGDVPFVGDFDGDGIDTIGLHRPTTGLVYLRNSQTTGIADTQFIYGNAGDRLVANDWNHDGKDTPALFRPSNITHYFRFTNTQGVANAQYLWGRSTWLPVTGTFGPG